MDEYLYRRTAMLKHWWYLKKDKLHIVITNLLPRWLVTRATVRLVAYATSGKYSNTVVPEITAMEAIGRWEKGDNDVKNI
jgi:predicted DCC family thiol-disulfide oxidoreductase YuxK